MDDRIATACVCCGSADLDRSSAILMPFVANRAFGWTPVEITPEWGLRTIATGWAYPLCNSMQCQACGLVFLDIRFDEAEMGRLYAGYRGPDYAAQRERFEPGYAAINAAMLRNVPDTAPAEAFLAPHVRPAPRVLDWGGDRGDNTPFARAGGPVDIYDISGEPVMQGVRRVSREDIAGAVYDLVILSHVLEHAPHPAGLVREAANHLGEGSVLYIEVPYEGLIAEAPEAQTLLARACELLYRAGPPGRRRRLRPQGDRARNPPVRQPGRYKPGHFPGLCARRLAPRGLGE